jgi:hypothetical protein
MRRTTARYEAEYFAALTVDAERARRSFEANPPQVSEQVVYSGCPATRGATNGVTDTLYLGEPAGEARPTVGVVVSHSS